MGKRGLDFRCVRRHGRAAHQPIHRANNMCGIMAFRYGDSLGLKPAGQRIQLPVATCNVETSCLKKRRQTGHADAADSGAVHVTGFFTQQLSQ